ncbi:MAG: glycosyltransferase, partial [Kiritimatiellia bacterium]|nr:glycosyltransferase [Kiritimatiellia bacterium]
MSVALVTLLVSIIILGYTWIGYPLLLGVCARLFGGRPPASDLRPLASDLPFIHVILSAYNEEPVIRARLENLVDLEYPADRLAIHVGTDGCSDRTVEIVRQYAGLECGGLTPLSD